MGWECLSEGNISEAISELPFSSVSKRVFVPNHSYESVFSLSKSFIWKILQLLCRILWARIILKERIWQVKNVPCNSTDFAAFVLFLFFFSGSPNSVIWYTVHFIQFGLEKAAHKLFLEHVLRSELLQGNPAADDEFCNLFLDPCQRVLRQWCKVYHCSLFCVVGKSHQSCTKQCLIIYSLI